MKERFEHKGEDSDARLHALLQIKRCECMDDRRWRQFEYGLEQKQLAAIVGTKQSIFQKWMHLLFGKKLAYSLAVLCIGILGGACLRYITSTDNERYYDQVVDVASSSSRAYVCDDLTPECSMFCDHGTKLSLNDRGIGYVRDTIATNKAVSW